MGKMDKLLRKTYKELKVRGKENKKARRLSDKIKSSEDYSPWNSSEFMNDIKETLMSDKELRKKELNEKINRSSKGQYVKRAPTKKDTFLDEIPF
jgi:hypothetical protein